MTKRTLAAVGVAAALTLAVSCSGEDDSASSTTTTEAATPTTAAAVEEYEFGEIVEISADTLMVVGRELDIENGQADIANSIITKADGTVYWIDSGATEDFLGPLNDAFAQLEPYDEVVLINTHGHADHVGNNALLGELGASETRHYIAAADIEVMRDQLGYFTTGFEPIAPYVEEASDPAGVAQGFVDLAQPLNVETGVMEPFESLPLESFDVDGVQWTGWSFGDDTVQVFRTQGHTAGEVIVYLPDDGLLHLSDEDTGFYQIFPGADALRNSTALEKSLEMVQNGSATSVTDGHTFVVRDPAAAEAFVQGLLDAGVAFDAAVHRILAENPDGITVPDLIAAVGEAPELADASAGANPNPLFGALQVVLKLDELGIEPSGDDPTSATVALPGPE